MSPQSWEPMHGHLSTAAPADRGSAVRPSSSELDQPPLGGGEVVHLDELTAAQRDSIEQARQIYVDAGGTLDAYWQPFLVRFLVNHHWVLSSAAAAQLQATAKWRASSGAAELRRQLLGGDVTFVSCPHVLTNLQCVWLLPCHSRSFRGDSISFMHVDSLDVPHWMHIISDDDYFQVNLTLMELQCLTNDRLSVESRTLVRTINLFDCHGVGLKHCAPRVLRRLKPTLKLADLYYPEMVSTAMALNAPWAVHKVWSLMSPFLSRSSYP